MYNIIVAHTKNHGIGKNGSLPWPRISSDMKHFRDTTVGHRVIMGRKTWESIGHPLPNRENIVISHQDPTDLNLPYEVQVYDDLQTAIEDGWSPKKETFVIGGSEIYQQCFENPHLYKNIQTIHSTLVMDDYEHDRTFPWARVDESPSEWEKILEKHVSDDNIIFRTYARINKEESAYLSVLRRVAETGIRGPTRTEVDTISGFAEMLKFDLSDGTIPILTTKRVPFRVSVEEMLFFVSGSTDVQKLRDKNVHIWDGNTTREFLDKRGLTHYEEYDMGPTYSFMMRHAGAEGDYSGKSADYSGLGTDQLQGVIDALKSDEPSRRIMMDLWSAAHLDKMSLPPCLFGYIFKKDIVKREDGCGSVIVEKHVSLMALMRSADLFLGVPFNLTGATVILRMVCHLSGCVPKELCLAMADPHVYTNHLDQVESQLSRRPFRFPKLRITRTPDQIRSIDGFTTEDFELVGYKCHPTIRAPMAV